MMLRIFLSAVDLVTPPVAAVGASFGLFIAQTHSNAIGDSSAVTIGLAMGAMTTVGIICLWVGRKTGTYDQRLKEGDDRMKKLEESIARLHCVDGSDCPTHKRK